MIAPCSGFFSTLHPQWAQVNPAIAPTVQTALSAGNVLIRLHRAHHTINTTAGWIYQFAFHSCCSLPLLSSNSCFHLKQNIFSGKNEYIFGEKKPKPNTQKQFIAKHSHILETPGFETSPSPKAPVSCTSCLLTHQYLQDFPNLSGSAWPPGLSFPSSDDF